MTKSISDLVEKALKELIEENKIVIKNEDGETMDDLSIEYEDDTSWEDDDNDNEDKDNEEDE
jgi:hypothetical protein